MYVFKRSTDVEQFFFICEPKILRTFQKMYANKFNNQQYFHFVCA